MLRYKQYNIFFALKLRLKNCDPAQANNITSNCADTILRNITSG